MKNLFVLLVLSLFVFSCQEIETELIDDVKSGDNVLLELVNQYRTNGCNCGDTYMPPVDPVVWDEDLVKVAQLHSDYLNEHNQLFNMHFWEDGTSLVDRFNMLGIDFYAPCESIYRGYLDREITGIDAIEYFMNKSPAHCMVIMKESAKLLGIAGSDNYWTLLLDEK